MNQDLKTYSSVSWEHVLNDTDDIIEHFREMNFQSLKNIEIISRTYTRDNRLIILITANNINGNLFRIIIDATSGIPTWQQFINVTYDQGEDTNINPGGHPKSPTCGHLKIPHPEAVFRI